MYVYLSPSTGQTLNGQTVKNLVCKLNKKLVHRSSVNRKGKLKNMQFYVWVCNNLHTGEQY